MKLHPTDAGPIPWARPMAAAVPDGRGVDDLERRMAAVVRRRFAVAVDVAPLTVALAAVGVGSGNEVVVPAIGDGAIVTAVMDGDTVPAFADVDRRTLGLSADRAGDAITNRTRAVVCGDFGGSPCDYGQLADVCGRAGLPLVIDGTDSLGSTYGGRPTLSYGRASVVRLGDAGGICFTDDAALRDQLRSAGGRMTDVQAATHLAELDRLDETLAGRRVAAARYAERLADFDQPRGLAAGQSSHAVFTILIPHRDAVLARLGRAGIAARACPAPLYRHPAVVRLGGWDCPMAESAAAHGIHPPLFDGITAAQQARVADAIASAVDDLDTVWLLKAG